MIENYEDLNREETLEAVSGFKASRLERFIEFERQHKARKTVLEPLKRRLVTVEAVESGYVAGHWFDEAGEQETIRRSTRVEQAIADGDLVEVE